jgi:uncharacterized protein YqfA (UPF0365 family)
MNAYLFFLFLFTAAALLILWNPIRYKLKATKLGVDVSWSHLIGLRLRNTMTDDILKAAAIANKEKFQITLLQLEGHIIAGGDPLCVINEMVHSKQKGQLVDFNEVAALDLIDKYRIDVGRLNS